MTSFRNIGTRSDYDFKSIPNDAELPELIDHYNKFINLFNFFNKSLSFQSNFNGYIQEVTVDATSSIDVYHYLGVIPKWRIILRQTGNGVITDIPEKWNKNYVSFYNNGATSVTFTVLIARE
jgi:hypothetical protein